MTTDLEAAQNLLKPLREQPHVLQSGEPYLLRIG